MEEKNLEKERECINQFKVKSVRRIKMKKLNKDIFGFTRASMELGLGSVVVGKISGGKTYGLAKMGKMMPMLGTTVMGGNVMRLVGNIVPRKGRKKKKK